MRKLLLLIAICPLFIFGQSLNIDRVNKIKNATVRISVEGGISVGTGFFVTSTGLLLTCWHVVQPAFYMVGNQQQIRKFYAEFNNGEILEMGLPDQLFSIEKMGVDFRSYDYAILLPVKKTIKKFDFLEFGDYSKVNEGQEVYTCGYPLAIPQQFISKGIISTKYSNKNNSVMIKDSLTSIPRNESLIDLTMNRGNSGGAIVSIGDSVNDGKVIGIADFIISPIGQQSDSLIRYFKLGQGQVELAGIDPNKAFADLTDFLSRTSIGVSGCVSINYVFDWLKGRD